MDIKKEFTHLSGAQHAQIIQAIERVNNCSDDKERLALSRNLLDFLWQLEQFGFITGAERVRYMDALLVAGVKTKNKEKKQ